MTTRTPDEWQDDASQSMTPNAETAAPTALWLPLVIILLAQVQLGFNVNALVMLMGEIVDEFDTTATMVGTALVVYSLAVAGLVMLGARFGAILGARRAFQIGVLAQVPAMLLMAFSTGASMMIAAQAVAGVGAAISVPAFVVLVAIHYQGKQQEQALGLLAAGVPMSGVLAFLLVGFLSVAIDWRWMFVMIAVMAAVSFVLSFRLKSTSPQSGMKIDWTGAVLAAAAITLISLGFNNVNTWGLLVARDDAPFDVLGLSPVPIFIITGIVLAQAFFAWLRRQRNAQKPQLFELEVLASSEERSASIALLIICTLGPAVNFLIPLYIQIVQGRSTLQTAVAIVPYALSIFIAATFVVRLYDRVAPRRIGRYGFVSASAGLFLLAFAIQNDWGTPLVILGLVVVGLGEGALLTLLFNVLVSASPKELAGHVGALRGTINNLATGLGTATAGVLAVAVLGILVAGSLADNPVIPPDLLDDLDISDVDYISNDELTEALDGTAIPDDAVDELVKINTDVRLRALKISFLVLAGLALLGIFPAGGLPRYVPGEVPHDIEHSQGGQGRRQRIRQATVSRVAGARGSSNSGGRSAS